MLIDQGGARIHEAENARRFVDQVKEHLDRAEKVDLEPTVTVAVVETHDGDGCDCIDKTLVLKVGQELELTHTCHDGRVDKVIAKVVSIDVPSGPEHGTAGVR